MQNAITSLIYWLAYFDLFQILLLIDLEIKIISFSRKLGYLLLKLATYSIAIVS